MDDLALNSLNDIDSKYEIPRVYEFLSNPENRIFLDYVFNDPFGCHVFPGDIDNYPLLSFFEDMEKDIQKSGQIHLWAYIPTCRYRCHFCQFPSITLNLKNPSSLNTLRDVVDFNIQEALMWLKNIPSLREVEVGEFNVFGGTPSLLPEYELRRLMDFYLQNFNFSSATMRFEGEPGTLNKEYLFLLKELGFTKVSFGVQSFNDNIIEACGRLHSSDMCIDTIYNARKIGLDWISIDLIYGMLGQSVDDVKYDLEKVIELDLSHVVCTKLHMEEFLKTRTAVSGNYQNLWQKKGLVDINNMSFPGLGKQYQMRELIDQYLLSKYNEHPTMYFHKKDRDSEKWKSIITDLDKQYPEVAIGLGGSSKCFFGEAINIIDYKKYKEVIMKGEIPIRDCRGISSIQSELNAFKMALSTLIPVDDNIFKKRFDGKSFFDNRVINDTLSRLVNKKLVDIRDHEVVLTANGVTLVEAIINTQFKI